MAEWKIVEEQNAYDTYGNKCRHAECPKCGFTWRSLYAVKTYFKNCPNCGEKLSYPEET